MPELKGIVDALAVHYGNLDRPPCVGPFQMVLWEAVAYMAPDERRLAAFEMLRATVGLTPEQILDAPLDALQAVTRHGGAIAFESRAGRLRESAQLVLMDFDGDLSGVLKLPATQSLKQLMRFPMIGRPVAEKILLFCGVLPVLALDSNGLRVLIRLGYGKEHQSYDQSYKSVREAIAGELPADCAYLSMAHELLRRHGKETCRRNEPSCHVCVVRDSCQFYRQTALS